jgi:hypothetical protein
MPGDTAIQEVDSRLDGFLVGRIHQYLVLNSLVVTRPLRNDNGL